MKIANQAVSDTHRFLVGTNPSDGYMYLHVENMISREIAKVKLTDENRSCLRKVLGPTVTWSGLR